MENLHETHTMTSFSSDVFGFARQRLFYGQLWTAALGCDISLYSLYSLFSFTPPKKAYFLELGFLHTLFYF